MGTSVYDEVELLDCEFSEEEETFFYPCPCGDRFRITVDDLVNGEELASCPSCSLKIRIIYEIEDLEQYHDGCKS